MNFFKVQIRRHGHNASWSTESQTELFSSAAAEIVCSNCPVESTVQTVAQVSPSNSKAFCHCNCCVPFDIQPVFIMVALWNRADHYIFML